MHTSTCFAEESSQKERKRNLRQTVQGEQKNVSHWPKKMKNISMNIKKRNEKKAKKKGKKRGKTKKKEKQKNKK